MGVEVEGIPEDPHPCHSGADAAVSINLATSLIQYKHGRNEGKKSLLRVHYLLTALELPFH